MDLRAEISNFQPAGDIWRFSMSLKIFLGVDIYYWITKITFSIQKSILGENYSPFKFRGDMRQNGEIVEL